MSKKYVAVIEMESWLGTEQHIVKGDNAGELLVEFEKIQSLDCLVRMGRSREDANGQKQLDKLEAILKKKYNGDLTIVELKKMDIKLTIGSFKCLTVEEGEKAENVIKSVYPKAR